MIKEVIVVEGINDTKRLKQFFDVDTIETHGMGLSDKTIDFIKEVNVASRSFIKIPIYLKNVLLHVLKIS